MNLRYFSILLLTLSTIVHADIKENLKKKFFAKESEQVQNKVPLVFHKDYDISLLGLEKLHPFDSCKYGKVYDYLITQAGISKNRFHKPEIVSDEDLAKVHSQEYLDSLSSSATLARITEIGLLASVPNFLLKNYLLHAMKMATGGTILGADLALEKGWAINLSGGYHHAKHDCGGGFCAYADIPLAITKVLEKNPTYKAMIIDLDAHQGNGHEDFFKEEDRVAIFDVYNSEIYPHDYAARTRIDYNYPVASGIADEEYLKLLAEKLPAALDESKPNFIIYNAGSDIFEEDPLGRMKISAQGIIKRDELVFKFARERNIPILMVLSGGYTKKSAGIIGKSIENILKNVLKVS